MNKKCQVFTPENYVRELLDSVGYVEHLFGKKYWKTHVAMEIFWLQLFNGI